MIGDLEAAVARNPLQERLRAQLMLALYRSGRQAYALYAYQSARRTLIDAVGIEPGPALQRLERSTRRDAARLAVGDSPGAPPRRPAPAGLRRVLGLQIDDHVGDREREALARAGDDAALEPVRAALGVRRDEDLIGAEGAQRILDRL